jgi:hypothetical protein
VHLVHAVFAEAGLVNMGVRYHEVRLLHGLEGAQRVEERAALRVVELLRQGNRRPGENYLYITYNSNAV